jgi:hypothetical protein
VVFVSWRVPSAVGILQFTNRLLGRWYVAEDDEGYDALFGPGGRIIHLGANSARAHVATVRFSEQVAQILQQRREVLGQNVKPIAHDDDLLFTSPGGSRDV